MSSEFTEQDMAQIIDLMNHYPDADLEAMSTDIERANAELEQMGDQYTLGPMPFVKLDRSGDLPDVDVDSKGSIPFSLDTEALPDVTVDDKKHFPKGATMTLEGGGQLREGIMDTTTAIFYKNMTPRVKKFVNSLPDNGLGLIDILPEEKVGMLKSAAQKVVNGIKSFIKGVRKMLGRAGEYDLKKGAAEINAKLDAKAAKREKLTSYENPLFERPERGYDGPAFDPSVSVEYQQPNADVMRMNKEQNAAITAAEPTAEERAARAHQSRKNQIQKGGGFGEPAQSHLSNQQGREAAEASVGAMESMKKLKAKGQKAQVAIGKFTEAHLKKQAEGKGKGQGRGGAAPDGGG